VSISAKSKRLILMRGYPQGARIKKFYNLLIKRAINVMRCETITDWLVNG